MENEKINICVYACMILAYIIVTIASKMYGKFARFSYIFLLILSPFMIGVKSSKRLELILFQLLYLYLLLYFGMNKICEDCSWTLLAFIVNQIICGRLFSIHFELNPHGNYSDRYSSFFYIQSAVVGITLTIVGFLLACKDVV